MRASAFIRSKQTKNGLCKGGLCSGTVALDGLQVENGFCPRATQLSLSLILLGPPDSLQGESSPGAQADHSPLTPLQCRGPQGAELGVWESGASESLLTLKA